MIKTISRIEHSLAPHEYGTSTKHPDMPQDMRKDCYCWLCSVEMAADFMQNY